MCGICGLWAFNGEPVSETILSAMNFRMLHRGPDDEGYMVRGGGGLAMRRLAIIDLSGGHQPLHNEDQTVWVILNGEIYNYQDIKRELIALGHHFQTRSDTEVIVHGYEQWGPGVFQHLNGMFATAIYDTAADEMLIARDRVGKKPLYYWHNETQFAFASEIKALLQHPRLERSIDPDALQLYLMLGYVPAPLTMFKSIQKLNPGCFLRLKRGCEPQEEQYWDLAAPQQAYAPAQMEEAAADLLELFLDAVRLRLVSDVPVGMLLSGGLDSTSVMAAMRLAGARDVKSFSVAFVEPDINEASYAQAAAARLGTDHHELVVENCSPNIFQKIVYHADEPLADPALVPTYLLSKLAGEHVKVVLSGEGADELFGGYFYHPLFKNTAWVDRLPKWMNPAVFAAAARAYNRLTGRSRYHPRTLWAWTLPREARPLAWSAIFTAAELKEYGLSGRPNGNSAADPVALLSQLGRNAPGIDWLGKLLYYELKMPLVDDLLMKVDKMSMAASIEARAPFLDYRMVELAARIPAELKLSASGNKLVLRRAVASIIPPEIGSRAKHPFHVPIRRWLLNDLKELFWDSVGTERFSMLGAGRVGSIQKLWSEMEAGVPGRAHALWLLFSLAVWSDQYLGVSPPLAEPGPRWEPIQPTLGMAGC
jgi:asparagine synthase (glutamine-hydrolysing)